MPNTAENERGLQPLRDFDLGTCIALPNLKCCEAVIPIKFEHDRDIRLHNGPLGLIVNNREDRITLEAIAKILRVFDLLRAQIFQNLRWA